MAVSQSVPLPSQSPPTSKQCPTDSWWWWMLVLMMTMMELSDANLVANMQIILKAVWIDLQKRIKMGWNWRIQIPPPYRALSCTQYAKSNLKVQNRFKCHTPSERIEIQPPSRKKSLLQGSKRKGVSCNPLSDAHVLPNMQIIAATVWIDLQKSTIGRS